jgi:hypothetical protein
MHHLRHPKVLYDIVIQGRLEECDRSFLRAHPNLVQDTLDYAHRNGLFYVTVQHFRGLFEEMPILQSERWSEEVVNLEKWKRTQEYLHGLNQNAGIQYLVIKTCSLVPHVPRDIDIFVHPRESARVHQYFIDSGTTSHYSTDVETSYQRPDLLKIDVYMKIQYLSREFFRHISLWDGEQTANQFGVPYPSPNDEAHFLVFIVHSVFGHRMITLLDLLHIQLLLRTVDIEKCRRLAERDGWGAMLDLCLLQIHDIDQKIRSDSDTIDFPYLFDREFLWRCIGSLTDVQLSRTQKLFIQISFMLDTATNIAQRHPLFPYLMRMKTSRLLYNTVGYWIRGRGGDRHGIRDQKK